MMQTIKIHISRPGKAEPDTKVTIPLAMLKISERLLPVKIKKSLDTEGINITELEAFAGQKGPKGPVIEIENANEKISILVE